MIRTYVIPETNKVIVSFSVPDAYIGKKVEVIAFQEDEGEAKSDKTGKPGNLAKFAGSLKMTDEEYEQWQQFLVETTNCQMKNLDVRHYLGIYQTRKKMQETGITNPSEQIKEFTRDFVEKLQTYSLDEEIILKDSSFFDSRGNLIMKMPD